jgi:HPt (histidine-containing phosphotransfer) domain-containing protein
MMKNSGKNVDLSGLKSFCHGNKKRMSEYIHEFLNSAVPQVENLNSAAIKEDIDEFRNLAHALKPQFQFLGIQKLNSLMAQLQRALSEKDSKKVNSILVEVNAFFEKSCAELIESLVALA